MNQREFEKKQELLTKIGLDYASGNTTRAFDRLCWFCNGLLATVKEIEDQNKELTEIVNSLQEAKA